MITEGKTDVLYIKAALKKICGDYNLVKLDPKTNIPMKFFVRSKLLMYYFILSNDGADTLCNIFHLYSGYNNIANYYEYFQNLTKRIPEQPVIILLDNEQKKINCKEKPLKKLIRCINLNAEQKEFLKNNYYLHYKGNLYLMTIPLQDGQDEADIESLFNSDAKGIIINGKKFNPSDDYDKNTEYGKNDFSKYVIKNIDNINFDGFKPLIDIIKNIINDYYSYKKTL